MRIGDFAFILFDEINVLPRFIVLGIQFDSFPLDCKFPFDLLNYGSENRLLVRQKLREYYEIE